MRSVFFLIAFLLATPIIAQHRLLHYKEADRVIFDSLSLELQTSADGAIGGRMVQTGRSMLGTPYVAQTLEVGEQEMLVVNLRGLDCTTFVENVLVMSRLAEAGKLQWDKYVEFLEQVRYRDGKLEAYPSRLHYFTDWIRDNERKGLVRDVTEDLGGVTVYKDINFMGTHRKAYPFLASDEHYAAILKVEESLSQYPLCILPAEEVANREAQIENGDIIALATDIKGLDVTHTGIAVRADSGRIHLLHASTVGEVVISEAPLAEYLKEVKHNTGIIVARPTLVR
jgi:cell wall-associated NlpC family hydrolase